MRGNIGTGIGMAGIWIAIGLISMGNVETFWSLSGWGFFASILVVIFV